MDVSLRLDGRVAVVTGGGRGLGRAMALALAEAGADLVVGGRNSSPLEEAAAAIRALGRRVLPVTMDATDQRSVEETVAETVRAFGRLDVMVNNAGIVADTPSLDVTPAEWQRVVDTNLNGVFYGCQAAARVMRGQGGGRIINIASAFGAMAVPRFASYCAAKAAVVQLTRVLAMEWARYQINVNAIAPGYFESDMNRAAMSDPKQHEAILRRIPQRRIGEPEELGPLAVYLASPAARYVTGETITIDGGMQLKG